MQGARTTRTLAPSFFGSSVEKILAAPHRAGKRIANPHRDRRWRRLAFFHNVEMRVEGRDLVDFGQRKLHLGRERRQMRRRQMSVAVLDEVQVLDQKIAPTRLLAEEQADFFERARLDLAALRRAARPTALPDLAFHRGFGRIRHGHGSPCLIH